MSQDVTENNTTIAKIVFRFFIFIEFFVYEFYLNKTPAVFYYFKNPFTPIAQRLYEVAASYTLSTRATPRK